MQDHFFSIAFVSVVDNLLKAVLKDPEKRAPGDARCLCQWPPGHRL